MKPLRKRMIEDMDCTAWQIAPKRVMCQQSPTWPDTTIAPRNSFLPSSASEKRDSQTSVDPHLASFICNAPARTRHWIAARKADLPKVDYFHLVFTVPSELRRFIRSHQRLLINILFKAASRSLMLMARDPKYIGARIGMVAVQHTWSRAMVYHPHIHCIVSGGGYDPITGCWCRCYPHYLVPVKALSVLFRDKFMAYAKKALPDIEFPDCKKGTLFLIAVCFRQYRAPPRCKPVLDDDLNLAA